MADDYCINLDETYPELEDELFEKYCSDNIEDETVRKKQFSVKSTRANRYTRKRLYKEKLNRRFASMYPSLLSHAVFSRGDSFDCFNSVCNHCFELGDLLGGGAYDFTSSKDIHRIPLEEFPLEQLNSNPYEHLIIRHGTVVKYHGSITGSGSFWVYDDSWLKRASKKISNKKARQQKFTLYKDDDASCNSERAAYKKVIGHRFDW